MINGAAVLVVAEVGVDRSTCIFDVSRENLMKAHGH